MWILLFGLMELDPSTPSRGMLLHSPKIPSPPPPKKKYTFASIKIGKSQSLLYNLKSEKEFYQLIFFGNI